MKYSLFLKSLVFIFLLSQQPIVFASEQQHPEGEITFYNASKNQITAQVNSGKFTLASNQSRNIAYSSLIQACSTSPTRCKANFYVNDTPAGSATLNVVKGKVVNMNLLMKVRTAKSAEHVLRSVVIQ